jgi:alkanesulfonate monooxygenase SsuD/methylene tetrahydromethanopterin reductase-like flavin-dependent oxidoreductase (luciferase family)
VRLALRFDMRAPQIGVAPAVLYPASVDMCEWGDRLGFETVYLAEHHGADDGYCPSPIVQASAIAARTTRMRIHFSALIAVLHHPLRLAEDLAVLDLISEGRIEMTLGIGYRPHEYEMMGVKK